MDFTRIILTGALGNVGSSMLHEILLSGDKVNDSDEKTSKTYWGNVHIIAIDIKNSRTESIYNNIINLIGEGRTERRFTMEWCDLTNKDNVEKVISTYKPHIVLHIAAFIPPNCYAAPPNIVYKVNVIGTKNLLLACNNVNVNDINDEVQHPLFVFSSSYSIHGPSDEATKADPKLIDCNSPLNPCDIYGNHKRICEEMIKVLYKGKWTILRFGAIAPLESSMGEGSGETVFKMIFSMPFDQRRHGCDTRDVGYALARFSKIYKDDPLCKDVESKIFMIGGDESWRTTSGKFTNAIIGTMGLLPFPHASFRTASVKDAWYYENHMDTTESQKILKFQRHSFTEYQLEMKSRTGFFRYWITVLLSPIILLALLTKSPFYWKGKSYLSDIPFTKVIEGSEIPEKEKNETGNDHI